MSAATASERLYERALRTSPAGTHTNSRAREPHPIFARRARGPHVWDADGRRWTDFTMGNAAVLLGYGDPHVEERVVAAVRDGVGAGFESDLAVEAAEAFLAMVPTADRVRFTNTGTEAAMHAVHTARAATGRPAIAKVEGSYHGWWDELFHSTWPPLDRAGPADTPEPVEGGGGLLLAEGDARPLVLPFNDVAATEALLARHAHRIAAVFIEPVLIDIGYIPADAAYLTALRRACDRHGIVLVFDELLTGFRVAPGGAQGAYGIRPDLSMWGKALANGFPIAALAGTTDAMEWTAPGPGRAPFIGTYNGYRPAMAACVATLERLTDGTVHRDVAARSDALIAAFADLAAEHDVPGGLHGGGGHIQPYFTDTPVVDYRSAATTDAALYAHWFATLTSRDILVVPKALLHCAFSWSHDDEAFEAFLDATREAFRTRPG